MPHTIAKIPLSCKMTPLQPGRLWLYPMERFCVILCMHVFFSRPTFCTRRSPLLRRLTLSSAPGRQRECLDDTEPGTCGACAERWAPGIEIQKTRLSQPAQVFQKAGRCYGKCEPHTRWAYSIKIPNLVASFKITQNLKILFL